MPASIKFSHTYKKLEGVNGLQIRTAKLLLVLVISQEQLLAAKDFVEYETDNGNYVIGYSTFYILMLLQKPDGDLFTTVRPQWGSFGDKQKYYSQYIGQDVTIVTPEVERTLRATEWPNEGDSVMVLIEHGSKSEWVDSYVVKKFVDCVRVRTFFNQDRLVTDLNHISVNVPLKKEKEAQHG
jgi:hypothetical protein